MSSSPVLRDGQITLHQLAKLADEFDLASRESGAFPPVAAFIDWLRLEARSRGNRGDYIAGHPGTKEAA